MLEGQTNNARLAALWMVHGSALVRLLRAHGRNDHASNLNAALEEITEILGASVGRATLSEAMDWASDQIWNDAPDEGPPPLRN